MAQEYISVGRRKASVARVRIKKGKGNFMVNGKRVDQYFPTETLRLTVKQPLEVIDALTGFDIRVRVHGGGMSGQAGAIRLGIARALVEYDATNRGVLKKNGFLTRDARAVERKKYGQPKARRSFQFSKR